jgi:hypothetical protein
LRVCTSKCQNTPIRTKWFDIFFLSSTLLFI